MTSLPDLSSEVIRAIDTAVEGDAVHSWPGLKTDAVRSIKALCEGLYRAGWKEALADAEELDALVRFCQGPQDLGISGASAYAKAIHRAVLLKEGGM